jgi:hypothetical protein
MIKLLGFIVSMIVTIIFIGCMSCPDCVDPACSVTMIDSTGNKLNGFTVKFTNDKLDTAIVCDTTAPGWTRDSSYSIFGKSGYYTIEVSSDKYFPVLLKGILVTVNRCGINNTRKLEILPTRIGLMKKSSPQYKIVNDFVSPGCGS